MANFYLWLETEAQLLLHTKGNFIATHMEGSPIPCPLSFPQNNTVAVFQQAGVILANSTIVLEVAKTTTHSNIL